MKRKEVTGLGSFPGFAAPGGTTAYGIPGLPMPDFLNKALERGAASFYQGKVRDSFSTEKGILMVTSDRVSAFDRILDVIPGKGEILNRISLYWFEQTADIIDNHIISIPGGRSAFVKAAEVLPVEVVVRGYLTGSAWRDYRKGHPVSGIGLPVGMRENQRFSKPLITPSTKAEVGTHDEPISSADIISRRIVEPGLWHEVEKAALALFRRGQELAEQRGLLLVDTKYEFGIADGKLILVDEIHTPDSSRYWYSADYKENFAAGRDQKKLDKEYLRRWLMDQGFMGDGEAPAIPDEVKHELAWKYIQAFELITGKEFSPVFNDIESEIESIASVF